MTRTTIAGGAFATVLVLLALVAGYRSLQRDIHPLAATSSAITSPPETRPGFLYGRIITVDGVTYEGRLRWGGTQEAFWGDYFNGAKVENPWVVHAPLERLPKKRRPITILGIVVAHREDEIDLRRLFMARFGDIVRIEARGRDVRVTLKSGTVFGLDRFEAGDIDDGVRVWDSKGGFVDLDSLRIRSIEFLPTSSLGGTPSRLHGTVRTAQGDFTGFIQWDREECVGTDTLDGRTAQGELSLRFDSIRSIARRAADSSLVTLLDGRAFVLSGTTDVGRDSRGIYVDDPRYGRVLIPWGVFERVDFSPEASGPAYADFPPGHPLTGRVTTRSGGRFTGRLVYDLDESQTTETLDAPSHGVNYTIPFGLVASIVPGGDEESDAGLVTVTLHSGEELRLERSGDLGDANGGMLVFVEDRERPLYLPWSDVETIGLDRPPAMYPPLGKR